MHWRVTFFLTCLSRGFHEHFRLFQAACNSLSDVFMLIDFVNQILGYTMFDANGYWHPSNDKSPCKKKNTCAAKAKIEMQRVAFNVFNQ